MSIFYLASTAIIASILGGIINFYLPSNDPDDQGHPQGRKDLNHLMRCMFLGIGATLLVPLFLELAKSKILDDVVFKQNSCNASDTCVKSLKIISTVDSNKKVVNTDTTYNSIVGLKTNITKDLNSGMVLDSLTTISDKPSKKNVSTGEDVPKNYLLWFSYCMIASIAGVKFINMLVGKFVTGKELRSLRTKLEYLEQQIDNNNRR